MRSAPAPRREAATADGRALVSVIIIFYQAERFLADAIESVLAQSYQHWELLLVDDGATDGSTAIARRYEAARPGRIRYHAHPGGGNRGASASRNLGIARARGPYVAFLDADDVWLDHKLTEQVAILTAHPAAQLVFGRSLWWHSWTKQPEDALRDYTPPLGIPPDILIPPPSLLLRLHPLGRGAAPCPSSLLFRRELINRAGSFEEQFHGALQLYEDQAWLTKVYLTAPVIASDRCWDLYRRHDDSCMSVAQRTGTDRRARRVFLDWLDHRLAASGVKDRAIRTAVRRAKWWGAHPTLSRLKHLTMGSLVKRIAQRVLPIRARLWLGGLRRGEVTHPPPLRVRFGSLRRLTPITRFFGPNPVDRYYIEAFLRDNRECIRGRVLEIGDDTYTRMFGEDRVERRDVLDVSGVNPRATIIADLAKAGSVADAQFDCIVITQTLQFIYDVRAAIYHLHRILKPGGTLLATFPGLSHSAEREWRDSWYWCFTSISARRLFRESFPESGLTIRAHGNVLVTTAFLYGLGWDELRRWELDHHDPDYEFLLTVKAVKPNA